MKKKVTNFNLSNLNKEINGKKYFHGYAPYHVEKGALVKYHEESSLNTQDEKIGRDFNHDYYGSDIDIYGSELDDSQQEIRKEDDGSQFL